MRFFIFVFLLVLPSISFAYEPTQTHAGLTEQVVEFYNLQFGNKITDAQKELMIKGAMEEDAPATRALNHFYDPVRNIGIEGGRTAKKWALDDLVANAFGWDDAIAAYARGDADTAFVALGHVVHLVEDMGVPDHTRNDQHLPFVDENLGGHSPYEDWAKEHKNRHTMQGIAQSFAKEGATPKVFSQLGEYFDFLANYSNKNFFSRDTIKTPVYMEPTILSSDEKYFYGNDKLTNQKVVLFGLFPNDDGLPVFALRDKYDTSVLSSYFDRLALQIIPSGAGVTDLFFKEGEKARIAYQVELRKKQEAEVQANAELANALSKKGFLGLVWSGAVFLVQDHVTTPLKKYVFRPTGNAFAFAGRHVVEETPVAANMGRFATVATAVAVKGKAVDTGKFLAQKAGEGITIIQQTINNALNAPVDPRKQMVGLVSMVDSPAVPGVTSVSDVQKKEPLQEVFVLESEANKGAPKLVFVGSFTSGVQGAGGGGAPTSPSPQNQVLGTQEETPQTEQETTATEEMLAEYEGAAGAAMAAPALSVPQCVSSLATDGCLLATTVVHFEWPVVSVAAYYAINKNGMYATTTGTSLDVTVADFSDYTFAVVAVDNMGISSGTSTQMISVATIPIAINEVAWMGTLASANDEWFELKNNTLHTIDLSQWALEAEDGTPRVKLSGVIAPRAYLIFERTNDKTITDAVAYAVYTGALGNTGEHLSLSYASTTLDQTPLGAWPAGYNSTTTKKTMERYRSKESGTDANNWSTNLGYIKNGTDANGDPIEGTPGAQNSVSSLINKGQDIASDFTVTADEERYVVPNGVLVNASSTLAIKPGVTISFLNDAQGRNGYFVVQGMVDAQGTLGKPIVLNSFSNQRTGDFWIDGDTGTSTFKYTYFENMNNVFTVTGGGLEIRDAEFAGTDGGVNSYGVNSTVLIENTHFASSTSDTIGVYDGSMVHIVSSTIENQIDGDAIGVYDASSLVMMGTTIDGVQNGNGVGAYDSMVSIASSTVRNTESDAILLFNSTSTITNTLVQGGMFNDEASGITVYGGTATMSDIMVTGVTEGAGISISSPVEPVVITGGEVSGNAVGVSMDAGSAILIDVSLHNNGEDVVVQ